MNIPIGIMQQGSGTAEVLIDSCTSGTYEADQYRFYSYGEAFSCDETKNISTVKFKLLNDDSATGSGYAVLYAMKGIYGTSGEPTGSALATSSDLDLSTLNTSTPTWETFTFSSSYQMVSGTKYCICWEHDSTSEVKIRYAYTDTAHDGNACFEDNEGDSWDHQDDRWILFEVYGD